MQVHDPNNCTADFYTLADTLERYLNNNQQWDAWRQLMSCWQARSSAGRAFGGFNRGHQQAFDVVKNLSDLFQMTSFQGQAVQIQYQEPKTFVFYVNGQYAGQVTPFGVFAEDGSKVGGKRKRKGTRKQRKSRKGTRKQRKSRKGTRKH